jgi:iron complex transport system ATP-binding protein
VRLAVHGLDVVIDDRPIVTGASVSVAPGTFHGLVGPNGSGKSTLLRCIYRALRPSAGAVMLDDDDLWRSLSARDAARRRAVVTQDHPLELEYSVREVVRMGRAPHKRMFERDTRRDAEVADGALDRVGMSWAADRLTTTLSGGERQRVMLARALAQEAPVLVLDEPTNHLDIRAQLELLEMVRGLGLTTIAALHDLDHAASLCDAVTVLHAGQVVASGPTLDVLTVDRIAQVFGVRAHIGPHPLTGRAHITVASMDPTAPPASRDGAAVAARPHDDTEEDVDR